MQKFKIMTSSPLRVQGGGSSCCTAQTSGTAHSASSNLSTADYWGMVKCRVSGFRTHYVVKPGLYSLGEPASDSDVFVTANYKMSFDILRRALMGLSAWILVLDTRGINVWCSAGKGTFGTDELIRMIDQTKLGTIVGHRRIIVPQLGAVGVTASDVKKETGFAVFFGPVRAADLPRYLQAGRRKTKAMSTIGFSLIDRLILTPMEMIPFMKRFPWFAGVVLLVFGFTPDGILFKPAWHSGLPFLLLGLLSVVAGAFLTPLLLPYIPVRSFALKGWLIGALSMLAFIPLADASFKSSILLITVSWLFFPALTSYIALQFTGSTTFTGMSGVKKELRIGVPIYIGAAAVSILLLIIYKIRNWGLL